MIPYDLLSENTRACQLTPLDPALESPGTVPGHSWGREKAC